MDFLEDNLDYNACVHNSDILKNGKIKKKEWRWDSKRTTFTSIDYIYSLFFHTSSLMFRTKEIIGLDRARFARAWKRSFQNYGDRGGDDPKLAFEAWYKMIQDRYRKHLFKSKLKNHPNSSWTNKLRGYDYHKKAKHNKRISSNCKN